MFYNIKEYKYSVHYLITILQALYNVVQLYLFSFILIDSVLGSLPLDPRTLSIKKGDRRGEKVGIIIRMGETISK